MSITLCCMLEHVSEQHVQQIVSRPELIAKQATGTGMLAAVHPTSTTHQHSNQYKPCKTATFFGQTGTSAWSLDVC